MGVGVCYDGVWVWVCVMMVCGCVGVCYDGVCPLQECRKNEILISKLRAKGLTN